MSLLTNIGGIQKIEITNAENITLGSPNTSNEVSVTNAGTWEEYPFTLESASFVESEKQVDEGIVYQSDISFISPKISPGNHLKAHKYSNVPVVRRITDNNGTVVILGSATNPVYLLNKKQNPKAASEYNRYEFYAKWQSPHPAYFSA